MVITITMRNFRIRNGIYWFRIAVPEDCRDAIGKDEISFSLETSDQKEAALLIPPHTKEWKKKFKEVRSLVGASAAPLDKPDGGTVDFEKDLSTYLDRYLADYIDARTDEELRESGAKCRKCISLIKNGSDEAVDLTDELGPVIPVELEIKNPFLRHNL